MNIFEQLNDIITLKSGKLLEHDEDIDTFIPYLTQRWVSMYSPSYAEIMNVSINTLWKVMDDKKTWYKLFLAIVPRGTKKRIPYIKKAEKTAKKKIDNDIIQLIANELEVSKREVKLYIEQGYIDVKEIEKQFNC
jgi:hypothetical protein